MSFKRKIQRTESPNDAILAGLKARAYDIISVMERAQAALRQVNEQIAELQGRPAQAPAVKPEEPAAPALVPKRKVTA